MSNILKRFILRSLPIAMIVAVLAVAGCANNPTAKTLVPSSNSDALAKKSQTKRPRATPTMNVDMRDYMGATIGGTSAHPGMMLCQANAQSKCLTSVGDGAQPAEVKIVYFEPNDIIDYISISSSAHNSIAGSSPYYIGVIRNVPGQGGTLRCFSTYGSMCSAPPNSFYVPEGVPYLIPQLPVVDKTTVQAASNADGSPKEPIPGAMVVTPNSTTGDYWQFGVWNMDSNCNQTQVGGAYSSKTLVAYVPSVNFAGNVGTQDAVVVDTFAIGPPDHAERYYYVKGLGRVREGTADKDSSGTYTLNTANVEWNFEKSIDLSVFDANEFNNNNYNVSQCPQGSYILPV